MNINQKAIISMMIVLIGEFISGPMKEISMRENTGMVISMLGVLYAGYVMKEMCIDIKTK